MKETSLLTALLDRSSEQCLRAIEIDVCTRDCQPRGDRGSVAILGLFSPYVGKFANKSEKYNYTIAEKEVSVEECAWTKDYFGVKPSLLFMSFLFMRTS